MNPVISECPECGRLLSQYQAATFEQAKIHDALDEANYLRDRASSRRLTLEAYEVTSRRRGARAALARHHESAHGIVTVH
jgi:hypothetical protein